CGARIRPISPDFRENWRRHMRNDLERAGDEALSGELRAWAARRFEATGASVDRMTVGAVDRFCGDGYWVRGFVVEQVRAVIAGAIAGRTGRGDEDEDEE
ncbi:MAG: hypothetical protein ACRDHN_02415, partial [Thermomicrobiales bacterium]